MSDKVYKKIKRQNGERFARALRDHHNGLLEIPNIIDIVKHAGRDADGLLPYLMTLLPSDESEEVVSPAEPQNPFELLDQAGYTAFHADTLEKQNSISSYFEKGELLCTFNDVARHERHHIIHAVKKDVDDIKRKDFKGKEERQDAYGTSVISIQMLKKGGFISIKNRYNHTVRGCDNTFNSNPDNIIPGLSDALKQYFDVDFTAKKSPLPEGYVLMGEKIFKYHTELNNIYYGDNAWAVDGAVHEVDKSRGDALLHIYLFENNTKTLKRVGENFGGFKDSFADDFNRDYGGDSNLQVNKGDLMLGDQVLIGTESSRIIILDLPKLTNMGDGSLGTAKHIKKFHAPSLKTMSEKCVWKAPDLVDIDIPSLETIGEECFFNVPSLNKVQATSLLSMGHSCFYEAPAMNEFSALGLKKMEKWCFHNTYNLETFFAPALTFMGDLCLGNAHKLINLDIPMIKIIGNHCFRKTQEFEITKMPRLKTIGKGCFVSMPKRTQLKLRFSQYARRIKRIALISKPLKL